MAESGRENGEASQVDWSSLEAELSAGALESLREHLQRYGDAPDAAELGASEKENGKEAPAPAPAPALTPGDEPESGVELAPGGNSSGGWGAGNNGCGSSGGGREKASPSLPASNLVYKAKDYWDSRFAQEESYDWLASYADIAEHLHEAVPRDARVLVVGCGNSGLSADMYDDGYRDLLSTDYSEVVIEKMRTKHRGSRPGLRWERMDMLAIEAGDASFDAVVDKAAMDALMVDKGDPWNPDPATIESSHRMCAEVSRVLVPGGVFVQLSFEQVHFRRKFLLGEHVLNSDSAMAATESPPQSKSQSSSATAVATNPVVALAADGVGVFRDAGSSPSPQDREVNRDSDSPQVGGVCNDGCVEGGGGVYGWDMEVHDIQRESGCFGHFLYVLRKRGGGDGVV